MHNAGYNTVQIAKELDRSNSSIGRFLAKQNLKVYNNRTGILQYEIADICDMYSSGITAEKILEKYKDKIKCENTIINIAKRNGIKIRSRGIQTHFDKNYFSNIDNEAKAYFLGLLLADGNVYQYKRNAEQYKIQIELNTEDQYLIEEFRNQIKSTNVIFNENRNINDTISHMSHFSVDSVKMAHDLISLGVTPRKSGIAELTALVPKELYRHYIRGYFDGNGTVSLQRNDTFLYFGFYGGHNIIYQIHEWLSKEIHVSNRKIIDKEKDHISFVSYSTTQDLISFYKLMYSDANYYMHRKKEKFDIFFRMKNIIIDANTDVIS